QESEACIFNPSRVVFGAGTIRCGYATTRDRDAAVSCPALHHLHLPRPANGATYSWRRSTMKPQEHPFFGPRSTLLAAAIAAVLGGGIEAPAHAQEQASGLEEVVVTGSRIARRDFTAASPIVTVGAENFENISTVGVEAALNQLPQFQPAGTQFVNSDVQASAFNTPGI